MERFVIFPDSMSVLLLLLILFGILNQLLLISLYPNLTSHLLLLLFLKVDLMSSGRNTQIFCHIYTDGSKVERKVASAYVCPYGTRSYRLRDGCSIFTAEVEAIDNALKYVKVSSVERFVIFSDSMSVLQAIESQESKNRLVNRVLQTCQRILSGNKYIAFCWIPSHKDIRGNEDADRAAKDALSKAQPEIFDIPCTDVFMKIQPFISSLWQERWDKEVDNKLHAIMPQIDEKYYSGCTNRKDEVIINRLE